jgi:chromosome partitioning protein
MTRLTCAICKGGTGKTTTAINLAAAYADRGDDVLAIDMDPRGGLTEGVGLNDEYDADRHIGQWLRRDDEVADVDVGPLVRERESFDVIPANRRMDDLSDDLGRDRGWFRRLDEVLEPLDERYDWLILDSPPELNRVSDSCIIAARHVVVPVEPSEPSMRGLEKLLEDQLIPIRRDLGEEVQIICILPNRTLDDSEKTRVLTELEDSFEEELAPVEIRKRVAIPRAWRNGESLFEADPEPDMLENYREVAAFIEQQIAAEQAVDQEGIADA